MNKITQEMAHKLIQSTNGKVFSVVFTKKDGSEREMTCRLGVKKHLKGGELAYDPKEYDLVSVFDMSAEGYRMVNMATLRQIKVDGEAYQGV